MQVEAVSSESNYYLPDHVPAELAHPYNLFADEDFRKCPFAAAQKLRSYGRVFWNPTNPLFRGSWVLTEAQDLRYVMNTPQLFSSKANASFMASGDALELIPLETDPPRHAKFRQLLNPLISPGVVSRMTEGVTSRAVELIEAVRDKGECDFIEDFAVPFPVSVFLQMMGLPQGEMYKFLAWMKALVHTGKTASDNEAMEAAANAVASYLAQLAEERKAAPRNDITTYVVQAQIDGEPLSQKEILGVLYMLFLAGLDTVTGTLGWFFHHLSENQEQQRQLRENPNLISKAVEEMLRRYSIVVGHRRCLEDVEVAGVQMKKGDWITVTQSLGSMDPDEFANPLQVDLHRPNVRHFAFAFGPHFCMGSHLARRELEISLREWLARVPQWRIRSEDEVEAHGGHTFGFFHLPLQWQA